MKRLTYLTLFVCFIGLELDANASRALNMMARQDRLDYIDSYKDIAIAEMNRFGIPASIKLAQAILESDAGQSTLARKAKNHFGIKCGRSWEGGTYYKEDDDKDHRGKIIPSCFRKYEHARESFTAHSEFLADPGKNHRYGFLFDYGSSDYERWAYGLKRAGYATNPKYPQLLIQIIQDYELYHFDNSVAPDFAVNRKVERINHIKTVRTGNNENLYSIAHHYNTNVKKLVEYNEGYDDPSMTLSPGTIVYLEKKKNRYYGKRSFHIVKKGDSMFTISQQYGIKLSKLLGLNRMEYGEEPAYGSRVAIGRKVSSSKKPALRKVEELNIKPAEKELNPILAENDNSKRSNDSFHQKKAPQKSTRTSTENGKYLDFEIEVETFQSSPEDYAQIDATNEEDLQGEIITKKIPEDPARESSVMVHIVDKGDTLYSIARAYSITVKSIKSLNGLTSNQIAIGQRLMIQE